MNHSTDSLLTTFAASSIFVACGEMNSPLAEESARTLGNCPQFAGGVAIATVDDGHLKEISGLAASRSQPGILWVHNDSGDRSYVYALDGGGSLISTFDAGVVARDWEDLAIGPGPAAFTDYLYVSEIGNNFLAPRNAIIYRFAEPVVAPNGHPNQPVPLSGVETINLVYPGGQGHNAEALIVDPQTGDIFIVTRTSNPTALVFKAPGPIAGGATVNLQQVGTVSLGGLITGGTISPDGSEIVIRTYEQGFLWQRSGGQPIEAALAQAPCPVALEQEPQGESISFTSDGTNLLTTSEHIHQPIYEYQRQ